MHLLIWLPRLIKILLQKRQGEVSSLGILWFVMDKIGASFLNFSVAMEGAMLVLKIFE